MSLLRANAALTKLMKSPLYSAVRKEPRERDPNGKYFVPDFGDWDDGAAVDDLPSNTANGVRRAGASLQATDGRIAGATEKPRREGLKRTFQGCTSCVSPSVLISSVICISSPSLPGGNSSLRAKPQQILFRDINQPTPFIFTKGHHSISDVNQLLFFHLRHPVSGSFQLHRSRQYPVPVLLPVSNPLLHRQSPDRFLRHATGHFCT